MSTRKASDNTTAIRSDHRRGFFLPGIAGMALTLALRASVADSAPGTGSDASGDGSLLAVSPPPFSEGIFPCSECHKPDDKVNQTPRIVEEHDTVVFDHDKKNRWCLDCHDAQDRDRLRLASGASLDFRESFRLCGQCHGTQLRDWKAGEHGKRTGSWQGQKQYLLCVNCHNPHSPRFKPLKPLPPPRRPEPSK